jgi:hypothetical protein
MENRLVVQLLLSKNGIKTSKCLFLGQCHVQPVMEGLTVVIGAMVSQVKDIPATNLIEGAGQIDHAFGTDGDTPYPLLVKVAKEVLISVVAQVKGIGWTLLIQLIE